MTTAKYKTRSGATKLRPVLTEDEYWRAQNDDMGFCVACGTEAYGVEPDARQYACEGCGEKRVYGMPELLVMGVAKIKAGAAR